MIGVTDGGFFTPAQKEAVQWQELQSGCHAPVVVYVLLRDGYVIHLLTVINHNF